mgnify:CR=1 FL=1
MKNSYNCIRKQTALRLNFLVIVRLSATRIFSVMESISFTVAAESMIVSMIVSISLIGTPSLRRFVSIFGEEVAKGEILVDYYLALEPPSPEKEIDGIDTIEPAYAFMLPPSQNFLVIVRLSATRIFSVMESISFTEPAYGIPSKWITVDKKEMAEIYGYTVIDPLSVMLTHLSGS